MKINWKRVKNHFKVFILGVVLTLGYRAYHQHRAQKALMTSPQRSEDDRSDAPGRAPFLEAEKLFILGADPIVGNSPEARDIAESLGEFLKGDLSMTPRVYCLLNGKRCVFMIQTQRLVAEEEKQDMWHTAQTLAAKSIDGYPTVAMVLYRKDRYGTLFVGGKDGSWYLRKEGGVFTLYPYFENADLRLATGT